MLGLFKRGKSTLINAMLGSPIVPTGVVPVTSAITRIRYGDNLTARISFGDGLEKEVNVEELPEYVTEAGNPDNTKKVAIADVFVPAPILKDGLILIDTPGVGSTYLSGTQITFQFLDRVDFAVFVLAVDPPIGQQEIELLSSLASKSNKILFVLNKTDYVDARALNESIKYCQKVISEHLRLSTGSSATIYPMSAKTALEGRLLGDAKQVEHSGIKKFETSLKESLINEKESLILKSAWKKLEKAAADLQSYVELEINSLKIPVENLKHLLLEFEKYLESVEQRKREFFYVLQGRTKEIVSTLDEDLTNFKKEHEDVLIKQVEDFAEQKLKSEKTSSRKVASEVDEYLKKTLIEVYSQFISNEDMKVKSRFEEIVNQANEKMNVLIRDVKNKAAQLFGIQAASVVFDASLNYETRFYYSIDPVFMTRITFSGGEFAELLPKSLFKGILKKRIEERVMDELDKNGGRIRYDYFITRLDQAVLKLKRDINLALESSTETVKRAVQEAERLQTTDVTEVFSSIIVLNRMLAQLILAQEQAVTKQLELGV
jgi:CRISPR/Cas system-associated exonuclease Cas4 (RecB family)